MLYLSCRLLNSLSNGTKYKNNFSLKKLISHDKANDLSNIEKLKTFSGNILKSQFNKNINFGFKKISIKFATN